MNARYINIPAIVILCLFAVSCHKTDLPWEEKDPHHTDQPGPDVPDTPNIPDTPDIPDDPHNDDVVDGPGDESLFTDVASWTGTVAEDRDKSGLYGDNEDFYWESNTWNDVVTVIFDGSKAAITKTNAAINTYCSGAHVTIDMQSASVSNTVVIVKGKSTDGSLKIYGDKKFKLTLCGLDLTSSCGPAINIQCHKRAFVHLVDGSTNRVSDAASYTNDKFYLSGSNAETEDRKAAFFSEGNLIFSGSGTLVVDGRFKHGLCTDGFLYLRQGPTLAVQSAIDDAFHVKGDTDDGFGAMVTGGCLYARAAGNAGKCLKSDMSVTIKDGIIDFISSGAAIYDSVEKDVSAGGCIKSDSHIYILGGSLTLKATGQAGKCIKAGSDAISGQNIVIGTAEGGPAITASTSGAAYGSSSSGGPGGGGGRPGGGFGGGSTSSSASSKAKCIKASGTFQMLGGSLNISTSTSGAEGIETKSATANSMVFSGGNAYIKAYDDGLNSAGQMVFNGGNVFVWATNNDAIDSNYGKTASILISGGAVFAHSAQSPEEAFDADSHSRITIQGGSVFCTGGTQGGSSGSPTHTVPMISLSSNLSVSAGYFTVTDESGNILFSTYVPRNLTSTSTFIVSDKFTSGKKYKYGMTGATAPNGSISLWGTYLYTGGTASVSSSATAN